MDKLSYALGLSMGNNFLGSGIQKLNIDDFAAGLRVVYEGAEKQMSFDEAKKVVTDFFTQLEQAGAENNERAGKEFLEIFSYLIIICPVTKTVFHIFKHPNDLDVGTAVSGTF